MAGPRPQPQGPVCLSSPQVPGRCADPLARTVAVRASPIRPKTGVRAGAISGDSARCRRRTDLGLGARPSKRLLERRARSQRLPAPPSPSTAPSGTAGSAPFRRLFGQNLIDLGRSEKVGSPLILPRHVAFPFCCILRKISLNALGRGGFGRPMVLGSGPSKSREFSWRRAARVLRAPRRTTPTGRGHQTGGTVSPDMMRVAWASSRFHTRMRRAAVELPVSGQIRHGSRSPAGGRAGCHERSRTGVAAGGTFPRTRCTSRGLSAGPELGRAALLWCSPAAFQIRHGALFARRTA